MVIAEFKARCPFEIGDIIKSRKMIPSSADVKKFGFPRYIVEDTHTITDIVCMHSVKTGTVEFLYELDGHGPLVRLTDPPRRK